MSVIEKTGAQVGRLVKATSESPDKLRQIGRSFKRGYRSVTTPNSPTVEPVDW